MNNHLTETGTKDKKSFDNEYFRLKMKDYYNSGKGKLRCVAYRMKKKYGKDNADIENIINDNDLDYNQKINKLKLFHFNNKYN